jgi:aminoglycoside phosphotransferase (APT) family kinase protein
MSNITILFDITWGETGKKRQTRSLVCRLQPFGQKLTFPTYDLGLQFHIMTTLGTKPGVLVPTLFASNIAGDALGTPFYIMEKTPGLIPPDIPPYHMDGWLCVESAESRALLWNKAIAAMSKFHRLAPTDPDLAALINKYDFPKSLDEQIDYWENYYHWALEGHENPDCKRALEWIKANKPDNEPQQLCWGDARMANVIFTENKQNVAALLDWEMIALGNPLQDLAWWIWMDEVFSHGLSFPRLLGFPDRTTTPTHWQTLTGLSTEHFHYYLVFAGMRFSLLLGRMSIIRGDEDFLYQSFASQYTIKVLNEINDKSVAAEALESLEVLA